MLRKVLEGLSVDTWERLRDAKTFDVRFGEETITDLLLLDLKRKAFQTTSVIQTSKYEEKNTGTDWEWWAAKVSSTNSANSIVGCKAESTLIG